LFEVASGFSFCADDSSSEAFEVAFSFGVVGDGDDFEVVVLFEESEGDFGVEASSDGSYELFKGVEGEAVAAKDLDFPFFAIYF